MTVGGVLKSIGKVLFALIFFCAELSAAQVKTELSDSTIHVGESSTLKIMVSGTTSNIQPVSVPSVKNLEIVYTGLSRNFQYINGDVWSGVVISFRLAPEKPGKYKIPPFVLKADGEEISSSTVTLNVLKGLGNRPERPGYGSQQSIIKSGIELSKKTVYAGEPLIMRYYLYANEANLFEVNGIERSPDTKGFVVREISESLPDTVENIDGVDYAKHHVATFCLIPTESGLHNLGGGSGIITLNRRESLFDFATRKRIVFPHKKIDVKKLPLAGKPDNYGGDVGSFKIAVEVPKGEFKQFDEIQLKVTVSGKGNLLSLSKPRLSQRHVKAIFEKQGEELFIHERGISGKKEFSLSIVPNEAGELNLGRVVLPFYNPEKGIYERASSEPLVLTVQRGLDSSQDSEVKFDRESQKFKFDLKLVLGLIGVFLLILGGVLWERRRLVKYKRTGEESGQAHGKTPVQVFGDDGVSESYSCKKNELKSLKDLEGALAELSTSHSGEEIERYISAVDFARYGGGSLSNSEFYEIKKWIEARMGH